MLHPPPPNSADEQRNLRLSAKSADKLLTPQLIQPLAFPARHSLARRREPLALGLQPFFMAHRPLRDGNFANQKQLIPGRRVVLISL